MIDVHVHLHPPRLFAAIRRWFAEHSDWKLDQPSDPPSVAAHLRAHGIERFAFCSYAHKAGIARELNAWLAATSRELDGFGLPLATVHLDDPDPLADVRAALDDGAIGMKVHEDVQRLALDDPRFGPVLDELARRGAFVLVHVGPIPWDGDTRNGPRRIAAVLAQHPALRIVVAHFGLPDHRAYIDLMQTHPHLYLDTTMAFAAGTPLPGAGTVAAGDVRRGLERIVLGTDWPNVPYAYDGDLRGLRALGIDDEGIERITRTNPRRLSAAFA